jgi:hypothetical protein
MKALLTFLMVFSFQAFADVQDGSSLKGSDKGVSLARGEIVSISDFCPRVAGFTCQVNSSVVKVKVTLNGCLDRLAGFTYKFEMVGGRGYLYFSAINVINRGSETARCVAAPTKTVLVNIPRERDVELVNMEFSSFPGK